MNLFGDERTERIFRTGFASGVSLRLASAAYIMLHLLFAAEALEDITVFSAISTWPGEPGRYGIHVSGTWYLTFAWSTSFHAVEVKLERRPPSDEATP